MTLAACGSAPHHDAQPAIEHAHEQPVTPAAPLATRQPPWAVSLPAQEPLFLAVDVAGNAYVAGACVGEPGAWCSNQSSFVVSVDASGGVRWRIEFGQAGGAAFGLAFGSSGALGVLLEQDAGSTATPTNIPAIASAPVRFEGSPGRLADALVRLDPATGAVRGSGGPHPPPPHPPAPVVRRHGARAPRIIYLDDIAIRSPYGFPTLIADPHGTGWVAQLPDAISRLDATPSLVEDVQVGSDSHALARVGARLATLTAHGTEGISSTLHARVSISTIEAHASADRLDVDQNGEMDVLPQARIVAGTEGVFVIGQYERNALACGEHHLDAPAPMSDPDGFVAALGVDGSCRWLRAIATPGRDEAIDGIAMPDGGLLVAAVQGAAGDPANARIVLMRLAADGAPAGERVLGIAGLHDGPRAMALLPDGDVLVLMHTDHASHDAGLDIPVGVSLIRARPP